MVFQLILKIIIQNIHWRIFNLRPKFCPSCESEVEDYNRIELYWEDGREPRIHHCCDSCFDSIQLFLQNTEHVIVEKEDDQSC